MRRETTIRKELEKLSRDDYEFGIFIRKLSKNLDMNYNELLQACENSVMEAKAQLVFSKEKFVERMRGCDEFFEREYTPIITYVWERVYEYLDKYNFLLSGKAKDLNPYAVAAMLKFLKAKGLFVKHLEYKEKVTDVLLMQQYAKGLSVKAAQKYCAGSNHIKDKMDEVVDERNRDKREMMWKGIVLEKNKISQKVRNGQNT